MTHTAHFHLEKLAVGAKVVLEAHDGLELELGPDDLLGQRPLGVLEARDGGVVEPRHDRHHRVEVGQLEANPCRLHQLGRRLDALVDRLAHQHQRHHPVRELMATSVPVGYNKRWVDRDHDGA